MMRFDKLIVIGVITLTMMLSLCACAAGKNSSGKGGDNRLTLALRSGTYSEVVKQSLSGFEEKYGISCEVKEYEESELYTFLMNDSAESKGHCDLCMVDGSWMAEFVDSSMLTDLAEMGYEFDDDIIPATTKVCTMGDSIYVTPYYGNVTVMMYNKDLLSESGLGEEIDTWDDVVRLSEFANSKGAMGYIYRGDTDNNIVVDFLPVLCAHGGWVVDDNNNPTVNTPEFCAAM
jgi:ABC-type glycerol-3-phosphate transport system substrate-binding protein